MKAAVNDQIRCPEESGKDVRVCKEAFTAARFRIDDVVAAAHRWCLARNPEPAA